MKTSLFALAVSLSLTASLHADDHARGLKLLAEGKFAEAAAAFRAAADAEPTDPRVHYNLALALWRAGDAGAAEIAAEQAATLSDGRLVPLRDGILGNLKMGEAQAKLAGEQPDLEAAFGLAQKARDHFLHGAAQAGAPVELTRNLERALQLIAEIEKKIDQQEKQDDEKKDDQKKDDEKKDEGKDGDKKPDEDKSDDKKPDDKKDDQKKDDEQKGDEKKPDEQKGDEKNSDEKKDDQKQQGKPEDKPPEPKPEEKPKPEQQQDQKSEEGAPDAKPGEDKEEKPEPKPGADEPQPPPGEQKDAQATPPPEQRELSPEETKRLLDVLQRLQAQQVELEKARAAARPKVKKDW